jgi:tetratricopeptide (TPR) repeat protein
MHSVFRIQQIKRIDENNRIWQVELTLTRDNNEYLRQLTEHIHEETFPNAKGWYQLGSLLFNMGQLDKAQQVYQVLLEEASSDSEKAFIYHQLELAKDYQGNYKEAVAFHETALEICQRNFPSNHPDLATSYNSIGLVYDKTGNYSKALYISQHSLPANHPDHQALEKRIQILNKL